MKKKGLISCGMGVTALGVLLFGLNEFSFAAGDIEKETYQVSPPREFIYKGKCALALKSIALISKDKKYKIGGYTFDALKAVAKEGYHEHSCSRTWEEDGFSYEANTKLYPRKIVHIISYKFTKDWEGFLYITPSIDGNLLLGASYRATDTDGLVSEGVIKASPKKYIWIPKGYNLKELELSPVEGGMIRYKIDNKNPLKQDLHRNQWAADCLLVGLLEIGEDGKAKIDARLNLRQIPPNYLFPAGYSNEIKLEIEFYEQMGAENIHTPFTAACYTEEPPVIDGKLDDPVWEKAEKQNKFYKSEGPRTWFSIAYDKKNIYIAVECEEPDFTKIRKGDSSLRDGNPWQDDSIEIVIDPKASRKNHFHFAVNFSNVRYDSKRGKGRRDIKWNAPNWRSATKENKDSWTLETAIPFEDMGYSFPVNEIWGFNITRNRMIPFLWQYTKWSDVKGNHNVERFGSLIFGKFSNTVSRYMELVEDEMIPLKKKIEKMSSGSELAKTRIELLAVKEEKLKKQVLSKESFSDKEAKALFGSLQSLAEEYQNLPMALPSFKKDSNLLFINPINIKENNTRILAKDFSRAENAVLDKDKQYVTRTKDPKPNIWAPTRLDYNLIVEKAGTYLLRAKLAAAAYKPIKLILDNKLLTNQFLSQVTRRWRTPEWFNQGAIYLTSGKHTLRFEAARAKQLPRLYEFELVRKEGLTPQQTLSMKFNVYFENEDLCQGKFIASEVNCFPNDLVRIEVSCINESKKPTKAKIALWSASEKKDVKTWNVNIPGGEICPAFIAQLRLPEKLSGLYRFSIPGGIEDFGLQKSGFNAIPLKIGPKPERPAKLELELVDEIDCTKEPDEKHPYAEYRKHKARVVTGPAGRYRLSGPYYSRRPAAGVIVPPLADSFGYRLSFKKEDLGKPFMIICDVPDDAMRVFAIQYLEKCSPRYPPSPGIVTGGKYPLSNKMVQLRFPCWPREEHPILLFITRLNGAGAACSKIQIYKVKSGYPLLNIESKGRLMGTFWEESGGIPNFFGCFNPEKSAEIVNKGSLSSEMNRRKHMDEIGLLSAARNYFEYKNYIGDNTVFLPACFNNKLYPSAILRYRPFPWQKYLNDVMSLYLKIAGEYGIGVVMELVCPRTFLKDVYPLDKKYTPSNKSPVFLVDTSEEAQWYNPIHPEVQEFTSSLVEELMELYGKEPGLKGIALRTSKYYPNPFFFPGMDTGYGDYTVNRFQKETGIKIPREFNSGQCRFAKRYSWLVENAREEWLNWRCVKMQELYQRMAEIIRKKRPDVKLYIHFLAPDLPDSSLPPIVNHLEEGLSWRDRLRTKGIDPLMYRDDKTIICTQLYCWGKGTHYREKGWRLQFAEDLNILPEIWDLFASNRTLMLTPEYYESGWGSKYPRGYLYPDFWNVEIGATVSGNINPAGRNMLGRYAISMALGDCQEIFDGGNATGTMGYEKYKREFARAFLPLPNVPFEPFSKQSEPVFLWQAKYQGKRYLYLANAAWHNCEVTLQVAKSRRGNMIDLSTEKTISAKEKKGDERIYELTLKSFELRSFNLPGKAEIISINTKVPRKEIQRLQSIEKEIKTILEKAKEPMKENQAFKFALDTFKAGKAALAEKRYFEAQRQFENYKLDRIYQQFGYPKGLKFLGTGQDFRLLTSGPATD